MFALKERKKNQGKREIFEQLILNTEWSTLKIIYNGITLNAELIFFLSSTKSESS